MELFVLLLVIRLSASEKLHRTYLPPPGAKFAGGISDDLKTPLEFPKETYFFEPGNDAEFTKVSNNVEIGTTGDEEISTIATGKPYTHPSYIKSGFETTMPPLRTSDMEYPIELNENGHGFAPGVRYPLNGKDFQHGTMQGYFGKNRFGEPGAMPIIAIPEGIMQNYQPKAFGMYGGSPMIIKSYSELPQPKDNIENHLYHPTNNLLILDEKYNPNNELFTADDSPKNMLEENNYQTSTTRPDKSIVSQKEIKRNKGRKTFMKRPERLQSASDRNAATLNHENVLTQDGYKYSFDTSNGIHKGESATVVDGVKAKGSYSYTGDDGKVYSVIYSADENGFQPKGDHIPTPPPIPEAIQKVIDQANRDKEAGIIHDGSYDEEKYGHMKYQGPVNRYLQSRQGSTKIKNRNRVLGPKKIKRPLSMKGIRDNDKTESDNRKTVQLSYIQNPMNNLNGQFGIKRVLSAQKSKISTNNSRNKPSTVKETQQDDLSLRNKNKTTKDSTITNDNKNYFENHVTILGNSKKHKITTASQDGYYYVPPSNIFIEGKFQKDPISNESTRQYKTSIENLNAKSIPVSGYYYIDQRDQNNNFFENPTLMTNYISTTEESINQQTYGSDFYESTNPDVDQTIENDTNGSEIPINKYVVAETTEKAYGNTLSKNSYNENYTKDIIQQYDTITHENDFPAKDNLKITNYQSTTPMPSQKHILNELLGVTNGYKTTYPTVAFDNTSTNSELIIEHEGYLRTIPAEPTTFEDFTTSTNIKVDGFGRPIPDSSTSNSPTDSVYNDLPFNKKSNGEPTQNTYANNIYEKTAKDDKTVILDDDKTGLLDNYYYKTEEKETQYFENENVNSSDGIIGEDFSGPKQAQGFDPVTGYFY